MGVTYKKLRIILAELNVKPTDINKDTGISWGSLTNISKDEYVNINTLEKIVEYLNQKYDKKYDIGDLVSIDK